MNTLCTTSWDDGYALDTRTASLLSTYGCKGTFYVCPKAQHGYTMLTQQEVRDIAQEHEIGAHTISHIPLIRVDTAIAKKEITESKQWVEDVTGKPCTMFCYPWGYNNADVQSIVQEAGYRGARTVAGLQFEGTHNYALPTTLQVAPFPWRKQYKKWHHYIDPLGPLRAKYKRIHQLHVPLRHCTNWLSFAKALLDIAIQNKQPFFHLWGHSHEVDRYDMWYDLEQFLAYAQSQSHSLRFGTNNDLI